MHKIRGLILKDILELKAYKKNLLIIIVIYSFLILSQRGDSMVSVGATMIMLVISMLAINTFHYDDKTKTDRYLLTLPVTKKEIVLSKYILSILSVISGAIIGTIISALLTYLKYKMIPNIEELLSSVLGGMIAVSFISSVQLPSIYKYGAEKGRMFIYVIALIIFILGNVVMMFDLNINLSFLEKYDYLLPIACFLLIAIMYLISYIISLKIYQKKEL